MDVKLLPAHYYVTAAYCAVALYTVIGGWRRRSQHGNPSLVWFFTLPVIAYVPLFYGGTCAWAVLYWLLTPWTEETTSMAATFTGVPLALLTPAFVVARLASGRAGAAYRLWMLFGSIALVVLNRYLDPEFFSAGNLEYLAVDSVLALSMIVATYAAFVGWKEEERTQVGLRWFLLAPIAVFVAYWFAGKIVWLRIWVLRTFAWPVDFPIMSYVSWSTAISALMLSVIVFARLATGTVNRRYLHMAVLGPVLLLAATGATVAYPVLRLIDGWTDIGAAENVMARISFPDDGVPLRLVREVPSPSQLPSYSSYSGAPIPDEYSSFVVYRDDKPITHIVVMPYKRFWWKGQSTGPIEDANE